MKNMKKIMTLVLILGLINTQIGCAGKITKISAPLDKVKLENDYRYKIILKTGERTLMIPSDRIEIKNSNLVVSEQGKIRTLSDKNIDIIRGQSTIRNGSYAMNGAIWGAGIGLVAIGTAAGIASLNCQSSACSYEADGITRKDYFQPKTFFKYFAFYGAMGAGLGALFGVGIGALIPKYNKVQITPIVSPTTSGVDAGVNVGVKF